MKTKCSFLNIAISAIIIFYGCSNKMLLVQESFTLAPATEADLAVSMSDESVATSYEGSTTTPDNNSSYIDEVVAETIAKFAVPDMSDYEKAKAAFDYIIEFTSLTEPIGLDLWRIRGGSEDTPSFVENRSLSVLLYGIGMCEDYAAAYTMLLKGMDIEAEYVPGLTYSATGTGLVDHAWTVAKIEGIWYHFDPQLEDNISRRDTIRYKYFMRGDNTMYSSHRWGQNLIDSRLLTPAQNDEVLSNYLFSPCPSDYPTPRMRQFISAPLPDINVLQTEIETKFTEYENVHGELTQLVLNIIPPVFGLEGYGVAD